MLYAGFAGVFWGQHGYVDDPLSDTVVHQQSTVGHWGDDNAFTAFVFFCFLTDKLN